MEDMKRKITGFVLGDFYLWELGSDGYYTIKENDFLQTNVHNLMEDIGD